MENSTQGIRSEMEKTGETVLELQKQEDLK